MCRIEEGISSESDLSDLFDELDLFYSIDFPYDPEGNNFYSWKELVFCYFV